MFTSEVLLVNCISVPTMPIPGLSKSYKQRLHVDRGNGDAAVTQSAEASSHSEEATNTSQGPGLRPRHTRNSSYQSDVDGIRRRSFLPQPGQARYSSNQDATASNMDSTNAQPPVAGRLRPRSMYQPAGMQAPSKTEEQTAAPRSIRPPSASAKSSDPQATELGRSKSLRKPGTSTQSAQPPPSKGHTRTKSSITSGLRKELNGTESSMTRPRSMLVAPGGHSKSNSISTESASTAPRASLRLAGLSRTSVKTRFESTSAGAATQLPSKPDEPVASHVRLRAPPKEEPTKTARPAFSTLQQHFTPRKVGKALTSTFLHPAPTPGATSLPPEIISLQAELLQLHLLHASSAQVVHQWHASARKTLRKKFEEVAGLHHAMLDFERAGQEQKNLQALTEWSSSSGLIEYIQILSGPLHELPALLEPGGRAERLMDEFRRWIARVEYIWAVRQRGGDADVDTIEGLGEDWKAENAAIARKVTAFARDLEQVRQPAEGSSIACLVDTCRELLAGLVEELRVVLAIEGGVVERERGWVEERLGAIARGTGMGLGDVKEEIPAWRA
ncbi:hypothetical protein HBI56_002740 [Parastagonospora nodorum]|uniref:Uncharacterized protein n=1 Tax=Phaeosphaeria nodorum (strain SN15 / ATCC MYA-4574 / FGSC 10173) TaxID=321614 RepID=A0A7U2HWL9_PHANO|nr:hypothetical protein HBH56_138310 [Parastagonospora nodorum]QRC91396.1 hypothetical protein JI435_009000 [Parastagonospora nodorum SN15]KAH3928049.1 hypothetical protein HBH54_143450 [Parastagonospora nodorum]KAH3948951.1 hypothetical protein HBH53_093450 [Parastagonospora nodorum]KAH3972499.1 hypothetical protein HBH52_151770 [Parastagonospora nodorum]